MPNLYNTLLGIIICGNIAHVIFEDVSGGKFSLDVPKNRVDDYSDDFGQETIRKIKDSFFMDELRQVFGPSFCTA